MNELRKNRNIFRELLENLPDEIYTWRQSPGKWCLLEIVCHLYDEEREDFRARVKSTLENPEKQLVPIDPQGWVRSRRYMERDYESMLEKFLTERDESIKWLENLKNPRWNNVNKHPKLGNMTANKFFVNWIAHDYLHIRQILKLKYDYLKSLSKENLDYAGKW